MSPVAKISRVLVGVDVDEASAAALKMAGALASSWDADITVFHSTTPEAPAYFTTDQIEALEAEREQSRASTADQLRVFAEQHVGRAVHVLSMPADNDTHFRAIVQVLKECVHPVLFVPSTDGILERSTS
jgi:hypothetical protein